MDLLKISDHMNRHPVTFTEEMSVEEAVNKLILAEQLGGTVINKEKKVIGFLTVKSYHGIVDLAQTMLQAKPKVYPVGDDDGYLLGVISRSDVLRAIDLELHSHYKAVS